MNNCEVCPILETHNNGADIQVFETEHWRGVLDRDQRVLGKMFVTLLEHRESLADLSPEQAGELFGIMRGLERAISKAYQPTHFNWQCLMNLAVEAGQPTHVHWHLHPRYDREVTVGDEVFVDGARDKTPHVANDSTLEIIHHDITSGLDVA